MHCPHHWVDAVQLGWKFWKLCIPTHNNRLIWSGISSFSDRRLSIEVGRVILRKVSRQIFGPKIWVWALCFAAKRSHGSASCSNIGWMTIRLIICYYCLAATCLLVVCPPPAIIFIRCQISPMLPWQRCYWTRSIDTENCIEISPPPCFSCIQ